MDEMQVFVTVTDSSHVKLSINLQCTMRFRTLAATIDHLSLVLNDRLVGSKHIMYARGSIYANNQLINFCSFISLCDGFVDMI